MIDIDTLHKIVDYCCKAGANYADVRYEDYRITSISVARGVIEEVSSSSTIGIGIRVLVNGSWGFASTDDLSIESLQSAVRSAIKLAKASRHVRKSRVELAEVEVVKDRVKAHVEEDPSTVPEEEKAKLVLEVDRSMLSYDSRIKDTRTRYTDSSFTKIFTSSEGSEIVIQAVRSYLLAYANAVEAGVLSPSYEVMGGVKGFEIFRGEKHIKMAKTVAERSINLLKAPIPKGGLSTVVLDNRLLGLIVHEAFGHTAEADLVLTGTILTGRIGSQIASELVTIVDDPGPEGANGWIPYDDEGVKARKVVIVERGVLKEYMQSRETAAILNMEPTGNGRAQNYSFPPIVRMRNTYMLGGDWDPEELIEDTREGFYLKGAGGGQADTNGEFMFTVQEAWRIERGELKEPYRGVTVSGNAIDVLKSVDAVGKDLKIESPGMCGKMQLVPVDGGGPHIRCKIMIGGRA